MWNPDANSGSLLQSPSSENTKDQQDDSVYKVTQPDDIGLMPWKPNKTSTNTKNCQQLRCWILQNKTKIKSMERWLIDSVDKALDVLLKSQNS